MTNKSYCGVVIGPFGCHFVRSFRVVLSPVARRSSHIAAHGPSRAKTITHTRSTSLYLNWLGRVSASATSNPILPLISSAAARHPRHHLACSSTDRCSPPPRRPHLWPSRTRTKDSIAHPQWTLTSARSEHLRRRLHMSPAPPRELLVPPAGSCPRRGCRSPCCPGLVGRMGRGRGRRGQHSPNSQRTASPMTTWASTSPLFVLSVISFFSI